MKMNNTLTVNGWCLLAHPLLIAQLEALITEVEKLKLKDASTYAQKKPSKHLAALLHLMLEKIPRDPTAPEYRQGNTLGSAFKHWFRAKFFQQYRLFFRYHLTSRVIVYAWCNDEDTKRAYDSNTDAYAVFAKMLKKGVPPNDWDALFQSASSKNLLALLEKTHPTP